GAAKADRRDRNGPAKARGGLAANRHCERSEAIPSRRRLRRIEVASSSPAARTDTGAQGETPVGVAKVVLSSGFSRRYTAGKREFDIEAKSLRDIIKALDQLYPGLGEHLEEETTVAIDGEIHDTPGYFQRIRPGCEVFFIPKLEGG